MAINLANNNSLANITALPSSISGGAMTLLATQTASGSANLSFTSGIDDTYDSYVFKFINIHPSANELFEFNLSTDSGSNYNVTKTTTVFNAYHNESDSGAGVQYRDGDDLAQSTNFQYLAGGRIGIGNDEALCGTFQLFNPSSTTFVKHFIATTSRLENAYEGNSFIAGYGNTTSAVNAVRFQMTSGNIDSGVIKLYGVS